MKCCSAFNFLFIFILFYQDITHMPYNSPTLTAQSTQTLFMFTDLVFLRITTILFQIGLFRKPFSKKPEVPVTSRTLRSQHQHLLFFHPKPFFVTFHFYFQKNSFLSLKHSLPNVSVAVILPCPLWKEAETKLCCLDTNTLFPPSPPTMFLTDLAWHSKSLWLQICSNQVIYQKQHLHKCIEGKI